MANRLPPMVGALETLVEFWATLPKYPKNPIGKKGEKKRTLGKGRLKLSRSIGCSMAENESFFRKKRKNETARLGHLKEQNCV